MSLKIFSFAYTPIVGRYLYHNSQYLFNGSRLAADTVVGTAIVRLRRPSFADENTPNVWEGVLYSATARGNGIIISGLLLPSPNVIGNIFGGGSSNAPVKISVELILRVATESQPVSFTQTTNLGNAPTV